LDLIGGSLFVNGLIDNDLVESVNLWILKNLSKNEGMALDRLHMIITSNEGWDLNEEEINILINKLLID
jgi:hypothetical protein